LNSFEKATPKHRSLVFDIETVPLQTLSNVQTAYLDKKIEKELRRDPAIDVVKETRKQMSIDPFLSRVACIGILYPETGKEVRLFDADEKVLLQKFWAEIESFRGVFISYNGSRFDCPYICKRSMVNGIHHPSNIEFLKYSAFNPLPVHFDACTLLGSRDTYVGLELVCDCLGIASPKDGAVKAEGVEQAYNEGRVEQVMDYCIKDLYATYQVYLKLTPYIYMR
jgi:predicted PolB exonuclease-like 3'-5' exonuclease